MWAKKTYPNYWNNYIASFDNGIQREVKDNKFVVLDTETTGFDVKNDRILSIGALVINNKEIKPSEAFEVYVEQEHYSKESVKIHGILKKGKVKRIAEEEALKNTLKTLEQAVLVAHHAMYDVTMLNNALKRQGLPKLKNKVLDTSTLFAKTLSIREKEKYGSHFTLDNLAEKYKIPVNDRHTALGDAYITAIAFLHILSKLKPASLNDLFKRDGVFKL
ncbi:3'-5' exonuclease [Croceitalea rosinachiae]|uniref:3'-5' exonuclease n=1 Tax=Croceitalea rosinachiae TaxID=3075596 RepID=A0ABU3AE58_9FLAO|nr:3'-5' exonuclease [Croceitalea sp. F388]MDT0607802.1 3'-5' exonuclease [Croceitalea sp. F388]